MAKNKDFLESKVSKDVLINEIFTCAGWRNKMFVKNDLMPHQIRITAVKKCRSQDLTDEECMKEGVIKHRISPFDIIAYCLPNSSRVYATPKRAFANLIYKLNAKDYWENNLDGYAYEFELVK